MKIPSSLETERLILRPFVIDDFDSFYSFMSDGESTRFFDFSPRQKTHDGAKTLLQWVIHSYDSPNPTFALAITDKATRRYVGSSGLAPLKQDHLAECFYSLQRESRGKGFATEATWAVVEYGFSELGLEKIIAYVSPDNPASVRVAERLGMENEGLVETKPETDKVMAYATTKKIFFAK